MDEMMSKADAYTVLRIALRIEKQIERALREGRHEDGYAMCRMTGTLEVRVFGLDATTREYSEEKC